MLRNRLEKNVAVISLLLGLMAGCYQYVPDIRQLAFGEEEVVWQDGQLDQKALAATPPLEGILNLSIPIADAGVEEWSRYLDELNQLEASHDLFGSSSHSKLGALYAQVALEKPEAIYQRLSQSAFDIRRAANLLQAGLLHDWYEYVVNPNDLLLSNEVFLLSYIARYGQAAAQKTIAEAFFNLSTSILPVRIDPSVIAYAYPAMTEQQKKGVMTLMKNPQVRYDPRDVIKLMYLNAFDKADLIELIENQAYSNKSMSSYMGHAALLGGSSYLNTFLKDVVDNDNQPTNFYCAACILALTTDGLVGQPLLETKSQGRLKTTPENGLDGEIAILSKGKPVMEWSYE